eukprot:m.16554 g.16554  ORF g.16554 m.16554 type:complete len:270 (+) comp4640_c0_seq1:50-859(+)
MEREQGWHDEGDIVFQRQFHHSHAITQMTLEHQEQKMVSSLDQLHICDTDGVCNANYENSTHSNGSYFISDVYDPRMENGQPYNDADHDQSCHQQDFELYEDDTQHVSTENGNFIQEQQNDIYNLYENYSNDNDKAYLQEMSEQARQLHDSSSQQIEQIGRKLSASGGGEKQLLSHGENDRCGMNEGTTTNTFQLQYECGIVSHDMYQNGNAEGCYNSNNASNSLVWGDMEMELPQQESQDVTGEASELSFLMDRSSLQASNPSWSYLS